MRRSLTVFVKGKVVPPIPVTLDLLFGGGQSEPSFSKAPRLHEPAWWTGRCLTALGFSHSWLGNFTTMSSLGVFFPRHRRRVSTGPSRVAHVVVVDIKVITDMLFGRTVCTLSSSRVHQLLSCSPEKRCRRTMHCTECATGRLCNESMDP